MTDENPLGLRERLGQMPLQFEGWRWLVLESAPLLEYISPDVILHGAGEVHGRIRVDCQFVPRAGETDPDGAFAVFCALMMLLEMRSESVCQFCGRHGQRYHVNPYSAYALCVTHAAEHGFIDLSDTRIRRD